jgi:putative transposase
MTVLMAFKTRLHANNKQQAFFRDCLSAKRVAYNFALGTWQTMYETSKADPEAPKPSAFYIDKLFNAAKKDKYPWMYGADGKLIAPSCVAQSAITSDIKAAFNNFFTRVKKGGVPGYPKFKKQGTVSSFDLTNVVLKPEHIRDGYVILPKGYGKARLGHNPPKGQLKNATISEKAGKWYISLLFDKSNYESKAPTSSIGVDVGVVNFATCSDGTMYPSIQALQKHQAKLVKAQRKLAKMVKGSNRWEAQKKKIATIHAAIANVRNTYAHQVSASLTDHHNFIAIEDLQVKNMTKSSKGTAEKPGKKVAQKSGLNKAMLNQGLGVFRQQLEYKAKLKNGMVVAVDPRYTSQACNACGTIDKQNRKSQAVFKCVSCGHEDNADVNAAKNILKIGVLNTAE